MASRYILPHIPANLFQLPSRSCCDPLWRRKIGPSQATPANGFTPRLRDANGSNPTCRLATPCNSKSRRKSAPGDVEFIDNSFIFGPSAHARFSLLRHTPDLLPAEHLELKPFFMHVQETFASRDRLRYSPRASVRLLPRRRQFRSICPS